MLDAQIDNIELTVDETEGQQANPADNVSANSSSANFAGLFATVTGTLDGSGDYGTDGPGQVSYALDLVNSTANTSLSTLASGLYALDSSDTSEADGDGYGQGAEIIMSVNSNGEIVGSVGGTDYFTISVDNTGEVTFTQTENIWHGDTSDSNDVESIVLDQIGGADVAIRLTQSVIDADGDTDSASVDLTSSDDAIDVGKFDINDDGPATIADTGTVEEGQTLNVASADGVLSNERSGTDGFSGGIVGVVAGNTDTPTENANVGTTINGLYGTLELYADGSYTYVSTANAITADAVDQFVYTVKDGDGDLDSAVLTINIADVTVDPDDTEGQVDEAGLPIGTDPASDSEQIINGPLSVQPGFTAIASSGTASFGTWEVRADGTYDYTLTTPTTDGSGPETDSFSYTAEDSSGNTVTNTVTITIIDDAPIAVDDSGSVDEGATLRVTAPDGVLDNAVTGDTDGADGWMLLQL